MDPILESYHALEKKVVAYMPNLDTKVLFDAFTYADTAHHGQLRKSGEPYIIHPIAVAEIVADLELDAIVYPHQQQLVCKIGGSQQQRNGVLCSATGFPSIAVPAGFAPSPEAPIGVPVGMEIIGRPFSEPTLIEIAYSFEQLSRLRRPPVSAPVL